MNLYDLCRGIHLYIQQYFHENNSDMLVAYSEENIKYMILQKRTENLEFFLTARKNLEAMVLLDQLRFFEKINLA